MMTAKSHHLTEGVIATLRVGVGASPISPRGDATAAARVGGAGRLQLANFTDEVLELLDAEKFLIDDQLGVLVDAVVGVQLLLQLNDGLVTLVQTRSQRYHDISLFQ